MKKVLLLFLLVCFNSLLVQDLAAQCSDYELPYEDLDINNVRARISMNGLLGFNMQMPSDKIHYEIPKGGGVNSLFAEMIWITALAENDSLHLAISFYQESDFCAGPNGITAQTSTEFKRLWKINQSMIDSFKNGLYTVIPKQILEWPGRLNPNVDFLPDQDLAPFFDVNQDGTYDPSLGDYPLILGDQSIWQIYSDGLAPNVTAYNPDFFPEDVQRNLNIEVQVEAFAYNTVPALENTTFYKFTITNNSSNNYKEAYLGHLIDYDLGFYRDDYVGTSVPHRLSYCYNGNEIDFEYREEVPIIGQMILKSPSINQGETEEAPFATSRWYMKDFSTRGWPERPSAYYTYIQGNWRDGTPLVYGGNGWPESGEEGEPYPFMYDSPPNAPGGYSECAIDNPKDDRSMLQSVGPFNLKAGETKEHFMAIIWSNEVEYPCPDITPFTNLAEEVQSYFDEVIAPKNEAIKTAQTTSISFAFPDLLLTYPNPATDHITIQIPQNMQVDRLQITNIKGQLLFDRPIQKGQVFKLPKLVAFEGITFFHFYQGKELVKSEKVIWN